MMNEFDKDLAGLQEHERLVTRANRLLYSPAYVALLLTAPEEVDFTEWPLAKKYPRRY